MHLFSSLTFSPEHVLSYKKDDDLNESPHRLKKYLFHSRAGLGYQLSEPQQTRQSCLLKPTLPDLGDLRMQ